VQIISVDQINQLLSFLSAWEYFRSSKGGISLKLYFRVRFRIFFYEREEVLFLYLSAN